MKCPSCSSTESKVVDSRPVEESNSIRRRRECLNCQTRFTTYEFIDELQPVVVKKNGTKEYFDKNKLRSGRPVDAEAIADEIELDIKNAMRREITSKEIGEAAMEKLRERDDVAYVRFASVYREFHDIETFMREIQKLKENERDGKEG